MWFIFSLTSELKLRLAGLKILNWTREKGIDEEIPDLKYEVDSKDQ